MKAVVVDSLVVVVDSDRQHLLGMVLSYHVLVQVCTDLIAHINVCHGLLKMTSNYHDHYNYIYTMVQKRPPPHSYGCSFYKC